LIGVALLPNLNVMKLGNIGKSALTRMAMLVTLYTSAFMMSLSVAYLLRFDFNLKDPIARREIPLARATAEMPPYPSALASTAAHTRRSRSLSRPFNSAKRCRTAASMLTRCIDTLYVIHHKVVTVVYGQVLSLANGEWLNCASLPCRAMTLSLQQPWYFSRDCCNEEQ